MQYLAMNGSMICNIWRCMQYLAMYAISGDEREHDSSNEFDSSLPLF